MPLCACGCGQECKNAYVNGHNFKGKHHSEEIRARISKANKNKHKTAEERYKISKGTKRAMANPEIRQKISLGKKGKPSFNKGQKLSIEQKMLISKKTRQAMANPEVRQKISLGKKGKPSFNKGKKLSDEQKILISKKTRKAMIVSGAGKKISDIKKEYFKTHSNPFLGKSHSEETKAKIRLRRIKQKNVSPGYCGTKGEYTSIKSNKTYKYKSKPEHYFMKLLDNNPNVQTWEYEAFSIEYKMGYFYTPDFYIIYKDKRTQIVEIKGEYLYYGKIHPELRIKMDEKMLYMNQNYKNYVFIFSADIAKLKSDFTELQSSNIKN